MYGVGMLLRRSCSLFWRDMKLVCSWLSSSAFSPSSSEDVDETLVEDELLSGELFVACCTHASRASGLVATKRLIRMCSKLFVWVL